MQDWCGTALRQTNYQQTFDATYTVRGFLHVGCACYTQQHTVDERQVPGAVWVSLGIDLWNTHKWTYNLPSAWMIKSTKNTGCDEQSHPMRVEKPHSQTTCKWPTNHLKHILDSVIWIPNCSMPDFSFVGLHLEEKHTRALLGCFLSPKYVLRDCLYL